MVEIVILLAIKKIGIALAKGAANQVSVQFAKYGAQLPELQGSMDRVARELRIMHDFLCKMDIQSQNNQVYESWLEEVQKVAHVMEDMVDEYLYLFGQEQDICCCFSPKKGFKKTRSLLSLNHIAFKVKEIEKDLTHLSETKNRWVTMINSGDTNSSNHILKRALDLANISRSLDDEDLVGVDEDREKLEKWLTGDDLECSVVALVGMGGLGKTALAANVYKKVREKFQCHAWVSISQTYCREDVLRNIIKELSKYNNVSVLRNTTSADITCLEETLKKFLEQQKYLIVLDDVWTPEAFVVLSRALIHNDKGSRLIITTRECDVAALASRGHVLKLEVLPKDKAWDLFCKKAFTRDTNLECPAELKPLSKQIVCKCQGLPLAIVSVGSLLRVREKTMEEWRRINNQLSWEIINNSGLDHIRNVLHLSFIYLPTPLKSCFLYCSLFPEDYLFKRKQLVRLWTAEGFMKERGESTLEEVAEGYLKELVDRNMLQLVERNTFGRMRKFRLHDILRELAVDLCQKNCFGATYDNKCGRSLEMDGRRLVLHKPKKDSHHSISGIHQLRTIITLDNSMPPFTIPLLCTESRYMTVLELSGLPIKKIPDAIGDLFNLRHLGLRDTEVKILPKSIVKLSNLLTLDVLRSGIHELPRGIMKLKKLRHLFAEISNDPEWREFRCCIGVFIPNDLGNLTNLQTLEALEAHDESVRHLGELTQLRSLRLWNVKEIHCRRISESLVQMQYLSNLNVNASDENEVLMLNFLLPSLQKLCLRGRLAEGWLGESPFFQAVEGQNLYELDLCWSQLREDPLPSLSRLSNLTCLHLTKAYNGEQLTFLTKWFPKLKILSLRDLPNLKCLEIQQGAMASLDELFLVNLSSLTEVPPGIEFLMPLQRLVFYEISSHFLMLLRQCSAIRGKWRYTLQD